MFNAKVYKIAVLSLSGMMEVIYAAKEAVGAWNKTKAESTGKMYMLIDEPLQADVLVGIVGNRIERQELVEEIIKAGKQVSLFFNAYADPKNTIASEQLAVDTYKEKMEDRCFNADYNGVPELSNLLVEQLNKIQ